MSKYSWIITKDLNGEGPEGTNSNAVGIIGPRDAPHEKEEIINKGRKFKMYDDDGILYYEGYGLNCQEFEPLDDYGMPNAGAVRIEWEK